MIINKLHFKHLAINVIRFLRILGLETGMVSIAHLRLWSARGFVHLFTCFTSADIFWPPSRGCWWTSCWFGGWRAQLLEPVLFFIIWRDRGFGSCSGAKQPKYVSLQGSLKCSFCDIFASYAQKAVLLSFLVDWLNFWNSWTKYF